MLLLILNAVVDKGFISMKGKHEISSISFLLMLECCSFSSAPEFD